MYSNLKNATPPKRVLGELDKTSSILRDLLNADFSNIHVNDVILMTEMSEYIVDIAPGREKILKLHDRKINIFEKFGITKQIKTLFGKKMQKVKRKRKS